MANAFTKAQFMEPPTYGGQDPVPVGAVKAGSGIEILPDGTINVTRGGGTINDIICTNGIQGGGSSPQVFIGLLPPNGTTIGGVYTVDGSGVSIDQNGLIRSVSNFILSAGTGLSVSNVTPISATVSLNKAGGNPAGLGGVYVSSTLPTGLQVAADGALSLTPPQGAGIGGVKAGTGCTIDSVTGVLNATGTGGTITAVGAGTGLGGGGIIGAVTLFLRPPSGTTIGGVYAGDNVTIAADGRLSISAAAGVQTVTGTAPVVVGGTLADPVISVSAATDTAAGVVQLNNDPSVPGLSTAPSSSALNQVYTTAINALPLAGGQMTGGIDFAAGQPFPGTVQVSAFTQVGGILVGNSTSTNYSELAPGATGQVLTVNPSAALGLEWTTAGTGTVTSVTGTAPIQVATGTTTPVISVSAASTSIAGVVQLFDGVGSTSTTTAATPNSVRQAYNLAAQQLPLTGGTMTGNINFSGTQTFPGTLPLAGGTMTGDITFAGTQSFPGVLVNGSIGGSGAIVVGGTPSNPVISASTATTSALGVVQPDGTTITINGSGVISATGAGNFLPLSGGTMTGTITFAAGQTLSGYVANTLFSTTGDIVYASSGNTPARLGIGAAGTILAVNGGIPNWRTTTQLGLLTSAAAATTYAPLNSPTFTGPVTVNAGGAGGSNALVVSGGSLVMSTPFTPGSSGDTGSTGEIAWDANYLYVCTAPNTWGRIAIDSTPF